MRPVIDGALQGAAAAIRDLGMLAAGYGTALLIFGLRALTAAAALSSITVTSTLGSMSISTRMTGSSFGIRTPCRCWS